MRMEELTHRRSAVVVAAVNTGKILTVTVQLKLPQDRQLVAASARHLLCKTPRRSVCIRALHGCLSASVSSRTTFF